METVDRLVANNLLGMASYSIWLSRSHLCRCLICPPSPSPVPRPLTTLALLDIAGYKVGQWYKTTVLVHLRGGYRPPGSSETLTVSVQLEGFVTA